jgi:hypothetical protein
MKLVHRTTIFALATATVLASMVLLAPLPLRFPTADLDPGWGFAMNEAVAQGKIFGQDISFTFGPYAAVYTQQYHPATEASMFLVSLLLGLTYGTGILYLGFRKNFWVSFIFPYVFLTIGYGPEAFFHTLPLLQLLVVEEATATARPLRATRDSAAALFVLGGLSLSLGILPIVKGSFMVVSAILGLGSFILMYRARPSFAWIGLAISIAALVGGWILAGQPVLALPQFFSSLLPIISGYTDGMSIWHSEREDFVFIAAAAILLIPSVIRLGRNETIPGIVNGLGFAATLFLAMKEGFVRHDGHAMLAASDLVAIGLLGAFRLPAKAGLALICVALLGWSQIVKGYRQVSPEMILTSAANGLEAVFETSIDRLHHDPRPTFEAGLQSIRDQYPFTKREGTADIYPVDQEILIANHIPWSPRPVIQSYSAYLPSLLALNRKHLEGADAPAHIYYKVWAIDGRFPMLDDAQSLPDLTTGYHIVAKEVGYAVLERAPSPSGTSPLSADPIFQGAYAFGQKIDLPPTPSPVWAEIDVEPTMLGRLINILFKLPDLYLSGSFSDGSTHDYRFLSGIGRSGFLISPVIEDTDQFIAFLSPDRAALLADRALTSFSLAPRPWARKTVRWLWQPRVSVKLRRFDPPGQPDAEKLMFDTQPPAQP